MENQLSINELGTALAKAQLQMESAKKDSNNPFFNSKYADLSSVIDAIKAPLSNNGLSYTQLIESNDHGQTFVKTMLIHTSGQHIEGRMLVKPSKEDMQGLGSAITYARRYSLQSICGLSAQDDDAEAAVGRNGSAKNASSHDKEVESVKQQVNGTVAQPPAPAPAAHPPFPDKYIECQECGKVISEKVQKYSSDRFGAALCFDCQKAVKK